MRVLIDADGCPVVNETISVSRRAGAECLILCDTAHHFEREGARTLTVSKGADSVDFALVNLVQAGDVVVTQDYGLAAMCLARAMPLGRSAAREGGCAALQSARRRRMRRFALRLGASCAGKREGAPYRRGEKTGAKLRPACKAR